jgi:ATP-binding cassette subfamily C protein
MLQLAGVSLGDDASARIAGAVDTVFRGVGVTPSLVGVLVVLVVIIAARAALQLLLEWWEARLEAAVVGRLRERLFEAVVAMPWARFAGERPAALVHAMGPQVDDVHSALLMLLQAVSLAAAVVAALAVALVVSPALTAVVVLAGAVLVVAARAARAPGHAEGERLLQASSGLFARLAELLGGMKMIHAHGAEARAVSTVAADTAAWTTLTRRYARHRALVSFVLVVLGAVMLAGLTWVSVAVVRVAPATLLLLLLAYARIVPRLGELQSLWSSLAQTLASFASVSALLVRCEAARFERDGGSVVPPAAGGPSGEYADAGTDRDAGRRDAGGETQRPRTPPALELRDVTVRYAGAAAPALSQVSAAFPAGTMTVVVGASGAGKTTLADVLLQLLDPEQGVLLVDGAPAAAKSRAAWRKRVAYLAQEPMLFHGTIAENLRFSQPGATDNDLWAALRDAACDFVERLPQRLDAAVGERGVLLSGGERQRLALARALLRRPDLLVLDEATSALDAETERRILETLRALRGRCTVVFATHREAPRLAADQVIDLNRD